MTIKIKDMYHSDPSHPLESNNTIWYILKNPKLVKNSMEFTGSTHLISFEKTNSQLQYQKLLCFPSTLLSDKL